MNFVKKHTRYLIIFILFFYSSCDQIKQVDRVIKKTFGQVNRFERQKDNYSKRLGLNNNKNQNNPNPGQVDNSNQFNSINQKNIINDYGYLFEMINGLDPGKVTDNSDITGPSKVFSVEDSISSQIIENVEVFGWHPHWMNTKWQDYPFNLLSTISYFSYNINPLNGNPKNPNDLNIFSTSDFVKTATENNTRVLLTVALHGEEDIINFLENPKIINEDGKEISAWDNLFSNIGQLLIKNNADGVDINFENLPPSKRSSYVKFVTAFKLSLYKEFYAVNRHDNSKSPNVGSGPFISMTVPASKAMENYSLKELSDLTISYGPMKDINIINLFVIMGYDLHSNESPGPTSPLQSENKVNSLSYVMDIYNSIGASKDRSVLALPYYGLMYNVEADVDSQGNSNGELKASIERKLTYSEINSLFLNNSDLKYEIELDPITMSKQLSMLFDDNSLKEIFYDDKFTLEKKYSFAMSQGLKGVGIWALGYDNNSYELWNLINKNFTNGDITYIDPIAEVNGFPIRFAKSLIKDKNIYVVVLIFLFFSVIVSWLILLRDWRVREKISSSRLNSFLFLSICYLFLIPLLVFIKETIFYRGFGIHIEKEFNLYIAMFLGALFYYIGSKITIKKDEKP